MALVYEFICLYIIPCVLMMHFFQLLCNTESKYQKHKLRNRLTSIFCYLNLLNETAEDGIRFHELNVICRNREFSVGVHKKDHSYRYTTYAIFINGDEAGTLHQIGDCCRSEYYFEKQNNREIFEVMEIIKACAKQVEKERKQRTKEVAKLTGSWNEYSFFK